MNAGVYSELARMALQGSGQFIPANSVSLIEARLSSLLMREGYDDISTLLESLPLRTTSGLRHEVIADMCSSETWFFREIETLNEVVKQCIPTALEKSVNGRVRIWCSGVSTGQEVLSLAMLLHDAGLGEGVEIEIVATDISAARVRRAKRGVYNQFQVQRGMPIRHLLAYFNKEGDKTWAAKPELLRNIQFRQHNLLEPAQALGQFDIILCRNVLKTMAPDSQKKAVDHLTAQLRRNGALIIGQTESLNVINNSIVPSLANRSIYERVSDLSGLVAA